MKTNAIDQIRNMMGLTDTEAVDALKAIGYTDEHIAIMRKTDDEMTIEEKESMSDFITNKFINSLWKPSENSETNEPNFKRITIDLIDSGNGYKAEFESDFSNSETRSIFINLALSVLKDMDIDVSSVEKQLEPLIKK
ncbi:hypothetical protein [Lentilactobacillus senioris]|uniref:hypothetical protein n=1 Tax=Lentilactobacillus senioris TaxID=931534 RepID=UPI003D27A255